MEILCIDNKFSPDQLQFYSIHKVVVPSITMYGIRDIIINSTGKVGLLLEELVNPKVPIKHPLLGFAKTEPNWDKNRFAKLDGTEITEEDIKQWANQLKKSTVSVDDLVSGAFNN
jgi:hypothetical protein